VRVNLGLRPRVEIRRGGLEQGHPRSRHDEGVVQLAGLFLADCVGKREAKLVVGERDGAMPVGRVGQHRFGRPQRRDGQREHAAEGGRVDRHDHIGHGKIGRAAFERLLQHPRLSAQPPEGLLGRAFILETPIDDPGDDRRNIAALWDLAGLNDVAPEAEKGFSMLTAKLKVKMDAQRKQQASAKRKIANALEARDDDRKPEPKTVVVSPFKKPAAILTASSATAAKAAQKKLATKSAPKKAARKKV